MTNQSKNSLQGLLSNARRDEISRSFETDCSEFAGKSGHGYGPQLHWKLSGQAQHAAFSKPYDGPRAPLGRALNEAAINSAMSHKTSGFAEASTTRDTPYTAQNDTLKLHDVPASHLPDDGACAGPRTRLGFLCGMTSSLVLGWFLVVPVATALQSWPDLQEIYSLQELQLAEASSLAKTMQIPVEPLDVNEYTGDAVRVAAEPAAPPQTIYRDQTVEAARFASDYGKALSSDKILSVEVETIELEAEPAAAAAPIRHRKQTAGIPAKNTKASLEPTYVVATVVQTSQHSPTQEETKPSILPPALSNGEPEKSSDDRLQQPIRSAIERLPKQEKDDLEEKDKSTSAASRILFTASLPLRPPQDEPGSSRPKAGLNERRTSATVLFAIDRRAALKRARKYITRTKKALAGSKPINPKRLQIKKSALGVKHNRKKLFTGRRKSTFANEFNFLSREYWERRAFNSLN